MRRGKPFYCEITVSLAVKEKLSRKQDIEIWEVEEIIYDDPDAFSVRYRDCTFVYGQTSSGRYLLVLVRVLKTEEIRTTDITEGMGLLKIITARDMNERQRKFYLKKRGKR
jgi:uncharacterized DUF497 family protein